MASRGKIKATVTSLEKFSFKISHLTIGKDYILWTFFYKVIFMGWRGKESKEEGWKGWLIWRCIHFNSMEFLKRLACLLSGAAWMVKTWISRSEMAWWVAELKYRPMWCNLVFWRDIPIRFWESVNDTIFYLSHILLRTNITCDQWRPGEILTGAINHSRGVLHGRYKNHSHAVSHMRNYFAWRKCGISEEQEWFSQG
jgi:hypothetical protein